MPEQGDRDDDPRSLGRRRPKTGGRRIVMAAAERFTLDDAKGIGEAIGIDWSNSKFDMEQFLMGLHVELEHGRQDPATDVTRDDPIRPARLPSLI
jgi:hypothetical protein